MAEGRKLENLSQDADFLRGVVDLSTSIDPEHRRPMETVGHFRNVLGRAVGEALKGKGVDPWPYNGVVRIFLEDVEVDETAVEKALTFYAPPEGSGLATLAQAFSSMRISLAEQKLLHADLIVKLFNLRLLAGGLDMREQHLITREDSYTDALTQLPNRAGMADYLGRILKRTPHASGGFILLDIDHFKRVNDTFGHTEGDKALVFVAQTFAHTLRFLSDEVIRCYSEKQTAADTSGEAGTVRWGGEELAGFLPDVMDVNAVAAIAERVRRNIEVLSVSELGYPLTVTLGATTGPYARAEELFKRADDLLYRGKNAGRNRVEAEAFQVEEVKA